MYCAMRQTSQIATMTRRTLAAWSVLLSLLLVWSFDAVPSHARSATAGQKVAVSLQDAPEIAAMQAKPSPACGSDFPTHLCLRPQSLALATKIWRQAPIYLHCPIG